MKIINSNSLPLDQFINFALYDKKNGYYMKKNPFGKGGDFITAPNITRLFSEILAVWTITFWKSIGSPKQFNLIELGNSSFYSLEILSNIKPLIPSFLIGALMVGLASAFLSYFFVKKSIIFYRNKKRLRKGISND